MHDFTFSLAARSSEERKTTAPIHIARIARYFLRFPEEWRQDIRAFSSRVSGGLALLGGFELNYLRSPEKRDKMTPVMQMQTRVHSSMNFYGRYIVLNEVVGAKNIR